MPQRRQQVNSTRIQRLFFALFLSLVVLGLVVLAVARPVFAGDFPAPRLIDSPLLGLNLTPQQQQKLAALETASESQDHLLIDQVHQLRRKLSDLYDTYSVDVAAVHRTNQQLNRVQGLLLEQRLSEQIQMRRILSPAQFTQLQAAIHKHEREEDQHHDPDEPHGHEMH